MGNEGRQKPISKSNNTNQTNRRQKPRKLYSLVISQFPFSKKPFLVYKYRYHIDIDMDMDINK